MLCRNNNNYNNRRLLRAGLIYLVTGTSILGASVIYESVMHVDGEGSIQVLTGVMASVGISTIVAGTLLICFLFI